MSIIGGRPDEEATSEGMQDKRKIAKISIVSSTVKLVAIHHLQPSNRVTQGQNFSRQISGSASSTQYAYITSTRVLAIFRLL